MSMHFGLSDPLGGSLYQPAGFLSHEITGSMIAQYG